MGPDLVLNDLSLVPAENLYQARQRMAGLVDTLRTAMEVGAGPGLWMAPESHAAEIAPGYSLAQWEVDRQVDRTAQQYLYTLLGRAPADSPQLQDEIGRSEYRFQGRPAKALGRAAMAAGLAVSLNTEPCWESPELLLSRQRLRPDGEVEPELGVVVKHAATPAHVQQHAAWIDGEIKQKVRTGRMLWEKREERFPSLDFCERSRKYILGLGMQPEVMLLYEGFLALEHFCREWKPGQPFDYKRIKGRVSPESQSTLQEYEKERRCRCSDGVNRLFSYHLKLGDRLRIYIHEDAGPGRLYIGPVDSHLSTHDFPS